MKLKSVDTVEPKNGIARHWRIGPVVIEWFIERPPQEWLRLDSNFSIRVRRNEPVRETMKDGQGDCPVCGEPFNHVVDNGYRNRWPISEVAVCTTEDTDHMWIHMTQDE